MNSDNNQYVEIDDELDELDIDAQCEYVKKNFSPTFLMNFYIDTMKKHNRVISKLRVTVFKEKDQPNKFDHYDLRMLNITIFYTNGIKEKHGFEVLNSPDVNIIYLSVSKALFRSDLKCWIIDIENKKETTKVDNKDIEYYTTKAGRVECYEYYKKLIDHYKLEQPKEDKPQEGEC